MDHLKMLTYDILGFKKICFLFVNNGTIKSYLFDFSVQVSIKDFYVTDSSLDLVPQIIYELKNPSLLTLEV